VGFKNESQEEEKVQMHMYRTEEFEEDFEEIEELDKEDPLTEENTNDEGIIGDSGSDSEDHEDNDPIQEFNQGPRNQNLIKLKMKSSMNHKCYSQH